MHSSTTLNIFVSNFATMSLEEDKSQALPQNLSVRLTCFSCNLNVLAMARDIPCLSLPSKVNAECLKNRDGKNNRCEKHKREQIGGKKKSHTRIEQIS